jgi:hypothetical protein
MHSALDSNNLEGISLGPGCPPLHSLLFADDLIVCGSASNQDAQTISQVINHFCNLSGQTPNWLKSAILFSHHTDQNTKLYIKNLFPAPDMGSSTFHLGHPLILPGKSRSIAYEFLIDRFKAKLTGYKANRLSHAGRLTLIKSVFSSIHVYYMSNILLSKKIISKLTSVVRKFWWTGIKHNQNSKPLCLRAWHDICKPIHEGGLGIRDLSVMNKALVSMSVWRLLKEPDSLTAKVFKAKYFPDTSIWRANHAIPKSAFWSSALHVLPLIEKSCHLQIAAGNSSVWSSPWCEDWKQIYDHLITQPGSPCPAVIKDLWQSNSKCWDEEKISAHFDDDMKNKILQVPLANADFQDELCWKYTPSGQCTTKSAYKVFLQETPSRGVRRTVSD